MDHSRDLDQPARVGDVVGDIEDAALPQQFGDLVVGELVVGRPADDPGVQPAGELLVQRPAERAGRIDVERQAEHFIGCDDVDLGVLLAYLVAGVCGDVGDHDGRAIPDEVFGQLAA